MNIVILKGTDHSSCIEIHFEVLHHYPGEYEGSRIRVTFYRNEQVERTIVMGWTNRTIVPFINLLLNFPLNKSFGAYYHFEKHLQLHWIYEGSTDLYLLIFEDQGKIFPIKTSESHLIKFGHDLDLAVKSSPNSSSYGK